MFSGGDQTISRGTRLSERRVDSLFPLPLPGGERERRVRDHRRHRSLGTPKNARDSTKYNKYALHTYIYSHARRVTAIATGNCARVQGTRVSRNGRWNLDFPPPPHFAALLSYKY